MPDTKNNTFILDIESNHKTRSIFKNVSIALVKEKVSVLGSKEIDAINNSKNNMTLKMIFLERKGM